MALFRIGLLLLGVTSLYGQITAESSLSYLEVSNLQASPDGKAVLFVVSTVDLNSNRTIHRLMKTSTDGSAVVPVAGVPEGVGNVR